MTKPLVYIAAPYTHPDPVENSHRAILIATDLLDEGSVTPICPHVTMLWHAITPRPVDVWYEYDLEVMRRCDAVLRLSGTSPGADREVAEAIAAGIPVFHEWNDLMAWVGTR